MNRRRNNLRRRRNRNIIYRRIRVCLTLLIFILILNKMLNNSLDLKVASNENKSLVRALTKDYYKEDRISIILDPGHGGYDVGADFGDIYEKDVVLNISNKVGEILEENGINVIYTRTTDIALGNYEKEDLKSRVDIANASDASYFISFHINDYECEWYEEIYGFEIWTNFYDEDSLNLGINIEDNLDALNYTEKRPMLDGSEDLYIIRENKIPSVLIEFGFMNYYSDRIYFSDEYNQELLAEAVANAILKSIEASSLDIT